MIVCGVYSKRDFVHRDFVYKKLEYICRKVPMNEYEQNISNGWMFNAFPDANCTPSQ